MLGNKPGQLSRNYSDRLSIQSVYAPFDSYIKNGLFVYLYGRKFSRMNRLAAIRELLAAPQISYHDLPMKPYR